MYKCAMYNGVQIPYCNTGVTQEWSDLENNHLLRSHFQTGEKSQFY